MVGTVVTEDTYDLAGIRFDPSPHAAARIFAQVRTSGNFGKFWF
jgi:hypothetical protein